MPLVRRLGASAFRLLEGRDRRPRQPGSGIPFEMVLRAQVQLAKLDFVRRQVFGEELDLLDRFLSHLNIADPTAREIARREHALSSSIRRIRRYYATLPPARQAAWLPLAKEVESALARGALLLATHFGGAFLTPMALAQLQIPILAIVRRLRPPLSSRFIEICDLATTEGSRAVSEAWATLRRGGIVYIAGDVSSGDRGHDLEVNVLGCQRLISRGFAELSVAAGVPPALIFSRVDEHGRVCTWVEPPLPASGENYKARVANLAQAYARRVSAVCRRYPGNVPPRSMQRCLNNALPNHPDVGQHLTQSVA